MHMKSGEKVLGSVPLFSHLSKRALREVAGLATTIDVDAGRAFIEEGDSGREFFVVLAGEAVISKGDTVIAVRGPGEFFGEISLLLDRPRSATVSAHTQMTLDVIERNDFKRLLLDHPELYEPLLAAAAQRLAELDELAG
jgi:CRP/FNR family transcriptional regulator, cyclic AMP receptor protein